MIKLSSLIGSYDFDKYIDEVYKVISVHSKDYPNLYQWYYQKVKNDIINGNRDIYIEEIRGEIAGISIMKKYEDERKISTFKVVDKFQKYGVGKKLLLKSIEYLDTKHPLITVNANREYQFKKLFKHYGFKKTDEIKGYYKSNDREIIYNGELITDRKLIKEIFDKLTNGLHIILVFFRDIFFGFNILAID